ncbi:MAG: Gfo/Idh/MocA family protein [Chitinophagaceae bacterium]
MSSNRRSFLKNITLSTGALAASLNVEANEHLPAKAPASFNMCGYAAPKLPTVRVGVVGLGMRGPGAVDRLSYIEGVEIKALCDKYADRVEKAQSILTKKGLPAAKAYSGEEGWKALCESNEIDLVYVTTPWHLHTPISVYAMKNGKHAASEVPAAKTIDECWELVETSEKTKKHMMMLENCCYDFFELLTLNMARNGLFGEIVHAEGAYIHDLTKDYLFNKNAYADMWRLKENMTRNGSLYPTHGLGPIAQCMNINRGDKFDYLISMSSNDFTMGAMANELASKDDFFKPYANKNYRGNMNTTVIKTKHGKTLMVQHDVSTIRPYSRIHLVSGTKGAAQKWPGPEKIALGHGWMKPEEQKQLQEKYTLPIVKHIGEIAKNVGGHGGMDFIMDWRLIDCLRNGLPLDQDVYDAASWTSAGLLSEVSLKKRSSSVDVPDFTRGAWQTNKPHDITLDGGGNTGVRSVSK